MADNHTDFKTVTNTNDKSLRSNNTLFFNYDIDSLGQNLNVTLDYTYNRYHDEDAFRNIVEGSESQGILNLNKGYGNTGIYVGSVDYTLPFRNGKTTLTTGVKYSLIQTDNHVDLTGTMQNIGGYIVRNGITDLLFANNLVHATMPKICQNYERYLTQ